MKSMETYEKSFIIKNEKNENVIKKHTWKNPYPEMGTKNENDFIENKENKDSIKIKEIKEDLTCFISRLNYIDDKNLLLGYPIKKLEENSLIPIPEILSYECFIQESSRSNNDDNCYSGAPLVFDNLLDRNNNNINNDNNDENNDNDNNNNNDINNNHNNDDNNNSNNINNNNNNDDNDEIDIFANEHIFNMPIRLNDPNFNFFGLSPFKSANNEFYDTWLPIYINKEHFEKNKTTILNYFSILKFGNFGLKEYDFHPQYIFEIMPKILAEMIKKMGDENISSSLIKCFFQNVLMFKKLEKEYKNIFMKYQKYFTRIKINNFIKENKSIDIKNEILELLILFYFSDNKINEDIKQKFVKYIIKLKNLFFLNLFESKIYVTFKDQNIFIKDLKKNKLFYKIVDIIFIDSDYLILSQEQSLLNLSEILRNKIIKQMNANFKELYMKLDYKIKQKIKKYY